MAIQTMDCIKLNIFDVVVENAYFHKKKTFRVLYLQVQTLVPNKIVIMGTISSGAVVSVFSFQFFLFVEQNPKKLEFLSCVENNVYIEKSF